MTYKLYSLLIDYDLSMVPISDGISGAQALSEIGYLISTRLDIHVKHNFLVTLPSP